MTPRTYRASQLDPRSKVILKTDFDKMMNRLAAEEKKRVEELLKEAFLKG